MGWAAWATIVPPEKIRSCHKVLGLLFDPTVIPGALFPEMRVDFGEQLPRSSAD
jgi:hypothetical protein